MALLHLSTSLWCLFSLIFFSKNGLNKLPWTCFIPDLHFESRIIGRGVPGEATDSPRGVWGRGWTTCLLFLIFKFFAFIHSLSQIVLLWNSIFILNICAVIFNRHNLYFFLSNKLQMLWAVHTTSILCANCLYRRDVKLLNSIIWFRYRKGFGQHWMRLNSLRPRDAYMRR